MVEMESEGREKGKDRQERVTERKRYQGVWEEGESRYEMILGMENKGREEGKNGQGRVNENRGRGGDAKA